MVLRTRQVDLAHKLGVLRWVVSCAIDIFGRALLVPSDFLLRDSAGCKRLQYGEGLVKFIDAGGPEVRM